MRIHRHVSFFRVRSLITILLIAICSLAVAVGFLLLPRFHIRAEVTTEDIIPKTSEGKIISGTNNGSATTLTTNKGAVTFQSGEISPNSHTSNALVVNWANIKDPDSDDMARSGSVEVNVRTKNHNQWSQWVEIEKVDEDRKDGTPALNKALVLADKIDKVQYRIGVIAGSATSPEVNLASTKLQVIDSSKGPSMNREKNITQKLVGAIFPDTKVAARAEGPRIYQREEWGGWENPSIGWYPNASPKWPEQYEVLSQIIIHHTATTANGDSFAAMRALWQFHANNNDWGDIGYNYVVDPWGNIFKGRHYVEADAKTQKGEVVAGHTFGHNRGTVGISVIGDYTSQTPTADAIYAVSRIAAFKSMPYGFSPGDLSNLIGHRDATSTGCPGAVLYARLPEIRRLSDTYYSYYTNMDRFDASYQGQGSYGVMWPNTESLAYLDIKNEGTTEWVNSGPDSLILITDRPRGRVSSICATGWLECLRVGSFSERVSTTEAGNESVEAANNIKPGETARFKFKIRAPNAGGAYREHFSFSHNNSPLVRDLGIYYDLSVPNPTYEWKMKEQTIFTDVARSQIINPKDLKSNTTYYARLKAYNAGNQIWYKNGFNPIRLATTSPPDRASRICDTTWIYTDCNRPTALKEDSVAPMSEGTFEFTLRTPNTLGEFREHFNLMVEKKYLMSGENQYWDFRINP